MTELFSSGSSAVISSDGVYRYRLDRLVQACGPVLAFFGVNGSTAGPMENDHTVLKWFGFTRRLGGSRFIAGNPFALRAKDVREVSRAPDPVGPDNSRYLVEIVAEADILVPCWGDRSKVRRELHFHFDNLAALLWRSGKPVRIFGLTAGGDPMHPLMLGYDRSLVDWPAPALSPSISGEPRG